MSSSDRGLSYSQRIALVRAEYSSRLGASNLLFVNQSRRAYMFISFLAMIADRVMLLPGTRVGKQTVMGSGAQGRRNTNYEDGSTWMGNGV